MNAAVAQERWQGQIIDGKFTLLDSLGGSPYSAVFRTELNGAASPQVAAIKLIRAENCNPAQQISQWKEAASLSHSNLMRIFDWGHCQINGAHWLYVVTEYAEENLDQVLPVRSLSPAEISEMLPPTLEALAYLHAKRLVHGRIKPSNIFAVRNQLKLSIDSVHGINQPARGHQLSAYDSPEIESAEVTGAADIWSLGMTLVAAFNQRPLSWSRSSQFSPTVPKEVPSPYSFIASECLRINPAERCSLQRIKDLSRQAVPVAKPVPPAVPKRSKNLAFAVAVVVAILGGLAIVARHSANKQPAQATPQQANTTEVVASQPPTEMVNKPSPTAIAKHSRRAADNPPASKFENSGSLTDGIVERVMPSASRSALNTIHGKVKVKVRVTVAPNGQVSSATLAAAGPSKYFARVALDASRKWKFAASQAASEWLIEWKFGRAAIDDAAERIR